MDLRRLHNIGVFVTAVGASVIALTAFDHLTKRNHLSLGVGLMGLAVAVCGAGLLWSVRAQESRRRK
jgi:hypothetical protein